MSKPFNHIEPGTPEYKKQLLKSQGEIKEDNSLNTLMRTWSKNNPKLSNAINIIPIIGTIKQGLEHGFDIKTPAGHFNVNSPFIKSLGGDVLTLLGIGQAAKAIG